MSFLNAKDKEALRDHVLAIRDRTAQILRILNQGTTTKSYGPDPEDPIPDGAWKDDPASQRQIDTLLKAKIDVWDQITKGEASKLIEDLFGRNKR